LQVDVVGIAVSVGGQAGEVERVGTFVPLDGVGVVFHLAGDHVIGELQVDGGGDEGAPDRGAVDCEHKLDTRLVKVPGTGGFVHPLDQIGQSRVGAGRGTCTDGGSGFGFRSVIRPPVLVGDGITV